MVTTIVRLPSKIVVQQRIVELLAVQDVEAERGLVQQQELRVDGHHQREVQLGHHALRQFPHLARPLDRGLREEAFRLRAIESRMHARDVVERLRDAHPARQHGDIGDEADVAHQLVALRPWVAPEYLELALVRRETEYRVQRRALAGAVGPDQTEDAAFLDAQVDAVQRNGRAVGLAQAACFYAWSWIQRSPVLFDDDSPLAAAAAVPAASGRAARWSRGSSAIAPPGTSAVRPASAMRARRR